MLNDQKSVVSFVIPNLEMVMDMIEKNIFRPLPNKKKSTNLGMSETGVEQEEQVDPSWPHLQVFPRVCPPSVGNIRVFPAADTQRGGRCEEHEGLHNPAVHPRSTVDPERM